MSEQQPSVGRVVHYVAYGTPGGEFPAGVHRAAIITEVDPPRGNPAEPDVPLQEDSIGIMVANPTGLFFNRHIPHDETEKKPGSWHWPEYVPAKTRGLDTP